MKYAYQIKTDAFGNQIIMWQNHKTYEEGIEINEEGSWRDIEDCEYFN